MNAIKIMTILAISSCCPESSCQSLKLKIPKPVLISINPDFKPINFISKNDQIILDNTNEQNLVYNIKMSRIYYNQSQINLKMLQDYYNKLNS